MLLSTMLQLGRTMPRRGLSKTKLQSRGFQTLNTVWKLRLVQTKHTICRFGKELHRSRKSFVSISTAMTFKLSSAAVNSSV